MTTSASRSTLITGIAAQTLASKRSWTPPVGRRLEELGSALRDELLVGRDDRLAGPQQVEDVLAGRLDAAHDLGHERDRLVLEDRGEVGRQDLGIGLVARAPSRGRGRAP